MTGGTTQTGYGITPVGCRGGSRYFWGGLCLFFWKSERFENWSAQKTKIPRTSKIGQKVSKLVRNLFWFSMIYLRLEDLGISKIYQDSTIVNSLRTLGEANCFGFENVWQNTKIPRRSKHMKTSHYVANIFWFNRIYLCFDIFRFPNFIKIPPS